jgi:exopolysaccharide production protein ExoY
MGHAKAGLQSEFCPGTPRDYLRPLPGALELGYSRPRICLAVRCGGEGVLSTPDIVITAVPSAVAEMTPDLQLWEDSRATEATGRRVFDVTVALLLGIPGAVITLAAAVLIIVIDRHSPFYVDTRVGRSGSYFSCLKLRTMRCSEGLLDAYLEQNPDEDLRYRLSRKVLSDPRKTRLGSFLRQTSIDELPQLVNVLLGQMSIVGPRPLSPREYMQRGADHRKLLVSVNPGLTGLWQVAGRALLDNDERERLELEYVRQASLAFDLRIVAATPRAIISRRGAF